eukprot:TRINITY_DN14656_c0_g1_i2.p1 TRINITY_DN14656_c0_g1~~TRINITY_DN14656_c0_g1_i2.p1  ORF type:complete len:715 (+),score=202.02 TRINITY_DN14656_c0_g1_i2:226-2370(+)
MGAGMSMLGEKSWYHSGEDKSIIPFKAWGIFPHIVAWEEEGVDLEDLVEQLGGAGVVILGIHKGSGMVFNKDGLVEPVRGMVQEYRWDWQSTSVKQALLIGPPRNTGLICPLYSASLQRNGEDEDFADAYAYALTQEEEEEEDNLLSKFDPNDRWLDLESRAEVEELKRQGNEAFKAGKADLAGVHYGKARILLNGSAKRWSDMDESFRQRLDALSKPRPKGQLPSERQKEDTEAALLGKKEDYQACSLQLSLLLNLCACSLLAQSQDVERRKKKATDDSSGTAVEQAEGSDEVASSTTLVEVKNNLVVAFRCANEALDLTAGRSAKAWFRRASAFEQLRDPRNALLDLEQALLRAPEDKAISKKRDEMRELAGKVAENMYYARHKELDKQEQRLTLETRRALFLKGYFGCDDFADKREEFAVAQPLARLVEGTLEEVDGRAQLQLPTSQGATEDAPYLHPHALWTWEFMVQRAQGLQLLRIEDVDLGGGPLEWLCKGLRSHKEIRTMHFNGVHLGAAGGKMIRNVLAQNTSLIDVSLHSCGLLDTGLAELSEGLADNEGRLEFLSLRRNYFTSKKLSKLTDVLCQEDNTLGLAELDLSENPLGFAGAKEIARLLSSSHHKLRALSLQECQLDLAAFWRLTAKLDNERPLAKLDLRLNPIGRGTRRCWRSTMGPTIRCEVLLSDHPLKALREAASGREEGAGDSGYLPLPRWWV